MKLASFKIRSSGKATIGAALADGSYLDLNAATNGELPSSMIAFLEMGESAMAQARVLAEKAAAGQPHVILAADVDLQAPVPRPGKIMHTSCNFPGHLSELTTWKAPEWQAHNWGDFHFEHPTGFLEAPSSVVPTNASVAIPHFTEQLDYEIEIGIVIGKKAFRVSPDEALDYVAGLTIFNDLSARDIQAREHSNKVILLGKSSKEIAVKEIMTEKVLYALPEQTVDQAMALMTDKHIRHLPVLDANKKVLGMVSIRDLLADTISEQSFLIQQLEQYIAS